MTATMTRPARRPLGLLTMLGVLLALVGGLLVAAPGPATAATWKRVDRNCLTVAGGTACASVEKSSAGDYRSTVSLTPAGGQWMRAEHARLMDPHKGGSMDLCGVDVCGRTTSRWSTTEGMYRNGYVVSFRFETAAGSRTVHAGRNPWHVHERKCAKRRQGRICVVLSDRFNRDVKERHTRVTYRRAPRRAIRPVAVRTSFDRTLDGTRRTVHRTKRLSGRRVARRWSTTQVVKQPVSDRTHRVTGRFVYKAGGRKHRVSVSTLW